MLTEQAKEVLQIEAQSILGLMDRIGPEFEEAVALILNARGRVILTGMGRDGVEGLRLAHSRGATVLAQAPETCAVPGMPSAAIDAGVVDLVLTPEQLADEIAERLGFRPRGEG